MELVSGFWIYEPETSCDGSTGWCVYTNDDGAPAYMISEFDTRGDAVEFCKMQQATAA